MTRKVQDTAIAALDRREFIAAAGAAAAATLLPFAIAAAPSARVATAVRQELADWHIDDMWGVYPRYSEPIGFAPPAETHDLAAAVHPVDAAYIA